MPLIGYARASNEDQSPLPQPQALKSAGCAEILEEQASGGNCARPVLDLVLERIGKLGLLDGASRRTAQAKGFTIRSWPSTRSPSCMSSLHSVVQPAIRAAATIIAP